jgi:hypothetical protein
MSRCCTRISENQIAGSVSVITCFIASSGVAVADSPAHRHRGWWTGMTAGRSAVSSSTIRWGGTNWRSSGAAGQRLGDRIGGYVVASHIHRGESTLVTP